MCWDAPKAVSNENLQCLRSLGDRLATIQTTMVYEGAKLAPSASVIIRARMPHAFGPLIAALSLIACTAAAPAPPTAPQLPDPVQAGWRGHKVCEVLVDNAQLRTARCTFPPSEGHERHFHAARWGYGDSAQNSPQPRRTPMILLLTQDPHDLHLAVICQIEDGVPTGRNLAQTCAG